MLSGGKGTEIQVLHILNFMQNFKMFNTPKFRLEWLAGAAAMGGAQ